MNHKPLLSAVLLATVLGSSAAAADVSEADRATARALFAEGHHALDKKDYATAADRFARADGLVHAPTLMLGFARAQVGLGKLVAAQEVYQRIIREGVQPGSMPPFFKALEKAKTEVDALAPRIPFLILNVNGPVGTKITVDGVEVPSQALGAKRPIDPGQHVVRATAVGALAAERTVTLVEGKGETVTLELTPAKASHAVEQKGSTQKKIGIIALGVGGAGLVLGGVTGGLALAKHGSLAEKCTVAPGNRCPLSARSALDSYTMFGTVSTGGFIAGGAAAALGTVLILTAPKSKLNGEAWIVPLLGPGYVGAKVVF